ncbi:MAG: hypothetical protein RQM92_04345 [Candidatus Syntrophopropionicum ammoniitolerans]
MITGLVLNPVKETTIKVLQREAMVGKKRTGKRQGNTEKREYSCSLYL